jgi:hypothetical protein
MPLEEATYIDGLNSANPLSTDAASAGDDHIRRIKAVLKSTFPALDGAVTQTPRQMNYPMEIGMISLWYGSSVSVPDGWKICDGTTHAKSDGTGDITTPDLRDKVVLGASGTRAQGTTGGSESATSSSSGSHSHTVTVTQTGSTHSHSGATGNGGNHDHGGATGSDGNHNHGGATAGHALTTGQLPAHTHFAFSTEEVTSADPVVSATQQAAYYRDAGGDNDYRMVRSTQDATVAKTSATGSGNTHTHDIGNSGNHTHTIGNSGVHTHNITLSGDGEHTHTATTGTTGAHTHSSSTVQPYMALHYIMKI